MQPFRAAVEAGDVDAAIALLADDVVVFRARVGDREIEGIDLLHLGAVGKIEEFTVLVRPLSAALALAEAMKARLGAAQN